MRQQEKGKGFFSKLNRLDWLIILVVVIVVGGIYFGLNARNKGLETPKTPISYDLEIKAVSNAFADSAKMGDLIKESTKGNKMGTVTKVAIKPAMSINEDKVQGKYVMATVPNLYDVVLTLETNAQMSQKSIVTDGLELKVGKKIFIKGKGYANTAFIMAIRLSK